MIEIVLTALPWTLLAVTIVSLIRKNKQLQARDDELKAVNTARDETKIELGRALRCIAASRRWFDLAAERQDFGPDQRARALREKVIFAMAIPSPEHPTRPCPASGEDESALMRLMNDDSNAKPPEGSWAIVRIATGELWLVRVDYEDKATGNPYAVDRFIARIGDPADDVRTLSDREGTDIRRVPSVMLAGELFEMPFHSGTLTLRFDGTKPNDPLTVETNPLD